MADGVPVQPGTFKGRRGEPLRPFSFEVVSSLFKRMVFLSTVKARSRTISRKKAQGTQKSRNAFITAYGVVMLLAKTQHVLRLLLFPFAYFVLFCGKNAL
jgi:hypothetical protein